MPRPESKFHQFPVFGPPGSHKGDIETLVTGRRAQGGAQDRNPEAQRRSDSCSRTRSATMPGERAWSRSPGRRRRPPAYVPRRKRAGVVRIDIDHRASQHLQPVHESRLVPLVGHNDVRLECSHAIKDLPAEFLSVNRPQDAVDCPQQTRPMLGPEHSQDSPTNSTRIMMTPAF